MVLPVVVVAALGAQPPNRLATSTTRIAIEKILRDIIQLLLYAIYRIGWDEKPWLFD